MRREGGELREEEREALPAGAEWAVRAVGEGAGRTRNLKFNIARCIVIYEQQMLENQDMISVLKLHSG